MRWKKILRETFGPELLRRDVNSKDYKSKEHVEVLTFLQILHPIMLYIFPAALFVRHNCVEGQHVS